MATVVLEAETDPSVSLPNAVPPSPSLSHRFLDSKFYLLVVIGELVTEEHLRRAIANIERGKATTRILSPPSSPFSFSLPETSYFIFPSRFHRLAVGRERGTEGDLQVAQKSSLTPPPRQSAVAAAKGYSSASQVNDSA